MFGLFSKNQVQEMEAELRNTQSRISDLEKQCADYEKTISAFPMARQDYDSKLSKQQKEYETKLEQLQVKLNETETSLNKRVNEELTKIGVSAFALEGTILSAPVGNDEVYNKFLSLAGTPEQNKYFTEHQEQITKAISAHSRKQ